MQWKTQMIRFPNDGIAVTVIPSMTELKIVMNAVSRVRIVGKKIKTFRGNNAS